MVIYNIVGTLLLFAQLPVAFGGFMCYQCATDSAIVNWSRFRLPMQQGDSMMGDDLCFHQDLVQSHIPCGGVCMTANITTESGHVVAVVRDCQYLSHQKKEELQQTEDNCITKEVVVHRRTMLVNYCYCTGEFCNGKAPLRRNFRRGSPSHATHLLPSSLLLLTLALDVFI